MTGKVTKLVRSYGATWGRITPDGETREVFFNAATLIERSDYDALALGQAVEFDEEPDRANGSHAVRVRLLTREAVEGAQSCSCVKPRREQGEGNSDAQRRQGNRD